MPASSRRDLLRQGGLLTVAGALPPLPASAEKPGARESGQIYREIGVQPLINARGTYTIITGSQTLPEVKQAMEEASRSYVQMDELMEAVSRELASLTGADWGIVTAGCAAALTHCTAASLAGCNPERMERLPDLTGLKSEVIIPEYSRNVYDHAIRMLGVKIIEPRTPAEVNAAFNERTAMVYILAGPGDDGPLGTAAISAAARPHKVPVLVDAAAEILTFPNVHLARGATVVAYSGGKCIRGPQAAGILLGDKNFLQAAWANSAPHHAFGRSLKVGKEEIMGMLAAVQMWKKRDHQAEWNLWQTWLEEIAAAVRPAPGVTVQFHGAEEGLSNRSPRLSIQWDGARLGITGRELSQALLAGEPRIALGPATGSRPDEMASSISITPYMMMPGDAAIVGSRIHVALTNPPQMTPPAALPTGALAEVDGFWNLHIIFERGEADHRIFLEQRNTKLSGTHQGEYVSGNLRGEIAGNWIRFRSSQKIQGTRLFYDFTGTVSDGRMSGKVDLGEYGRAQWSAERHPDEAPGGSVRPVQPA